MFSAPARRPGAGRPRQGSAGPPRLLTNVMSMCMFIFIKTS